MLEEAVWWLSSWHSFSQTLMKLCPTEALIGLCSLLDGMENWDLHCSSFITTPRHFMCERESRTIHPGSPGQIPVLIIVFCLASFVFSLDCYSSLFPNPRCWYKCFPGQRWESCLVEGGAILLPLNFIEYFDIFSKGDLCERLIASCGNIWTGWAFQLPRPERL